MRVHALLGVCVIGAVAACASSDRQARAKSAKDTAQHDAPDIRAPHRPRVLWDALPPTDAAFPCLMNAPVDVSPSAKRKRADDLARIKVLLRKVSPEQQAELVARLAVLYLEEGGAEFVAAAAGEKGASVRRAQQLDQQGHRNFVTLVEHYPNAVVTPDYLVDAALSLLQDGRRDPGVALLQRIRAGGGQDAARAAIALGDVYFVDGAIEEARAAYGEGCPTPTQDELCRYAAARTGQLAAR